MSYDQCPEGLKFTGEQLVESMGFQLDRTGRNIGILVGQFFAYRLLGVLILSIKFYVQTATQRPKFMVKFHAKYYNTKKFINFGIFKFLIKSCISSKIVF